MEPAGDVRARQNRRARFAFVAAFLIGALPILLIGLRAGRPVESDAWFHLAIARDYAGAPLAYDDRIREGVLSRYPSDREPLFHLALAAQNAAGIPAEIAATLTPAAAAGALGAVLYAHSRSLLVVLCGVFAGNTFLFRLLMCRPHGFAIVLVIWGVSCLLQRRYRTLAVLNLVYAWSYSVPLLLLFASTLESLARRRWTAFGLCVASSLIGLCVHPQFPNNVIVLWYQGFHVMRDALFAAPGVEIPDELKPWSLTAFLLDAWLPLALSILLFVRRASERWYLLLLALLLLLTLRSLRFVEYWAPLVALGSGPAIESLVPRQSRVARCALIALFILVRPLVSDIAVDRQAAALTRDPPRYAQAGEWLREHASGAKVFNAEWDAYAELRYFGGNFELLHGADPAFLRRSDPARWREVMDVIEGASDPAEFRTRFDYDFIVASELSPLARWAEQPGVATRWRGGGVLVLEVLAPELRER